MSGELRLAARELAAVDLALSTTRAIRRRLDLTRPVDPVIVQEALAVAVQAPSGGAEEPMRWLVVTDPGTRVRIADAYREAYTGFDRERAQPSGEGADRIRRVRASSAYLAEVMADVPVIVVVCSAAAPPEAPTGPSAAKYYASVYPAVWSFQVALRARGLGSCLTTIGLRQEEAMAKILALPANWRQCALLPVAHITGTGLKPAERRPLREVVRWI